MRPSAVTTLVRSLKNIKDLLDGVLIIIWILISFQLYAMIKDIRNEYNIKDTSAYTELKVNDRTDGVVLLYNSSTGEVRAGKVADSK